MTVGAYIHKEKKLSGQSAGCQSQHGGDALVCDEVVFRVYVISSDVPLFIHFRFHLGCSLKGSLSHFLSPWKH